MWLSSAGRMLSERVSAVAAVAGAAPRRHLWEWVTFMFNKPDQERIAAFGADRACAEWVLRNGGKVALEGGQRIDNYNSLPDENVRFRLEVIDATDSAISHYGFPHLRNCTGIKSIKLVGCGYVGDEALSQLRLVAESLECLEIVDCKNLTDEGLRQIIALAKLKSVRISQLPYVRDLAGEKEAIQAALPGCRVE